MLTDAQVTAVVPTTDLARARNFFEVLTKRGRHGFIAVKDDRFKDAPIVVARCARKLPAGAEVTGLPEYP